jgi:hypothetical protein
MPTKSRYLDYSPQEQADRIKHARRALQDGVDAKALEKAGIYSKTEIKQARQGLEKK